jgi:zinc protease
MTRLHRFVAVLVFASVTVAWSLAPVPAAAMAIERVISPGGIEAWLVRETAIPLLTMDFAFSGGAAQDPADKPGVGNMVASLLDEGAGDLDSRSFHQRLETHSIHLRFQVGRDHFMGSLQTIGEFRDEAAELMQLALTAPRFDSVAMERIRGQILSGLGRATVSPGDIASRRWWATAFPGHPYGRQSSGTLESVPTITADDLRDYTKRVLARDTLKIAIVGDLDAAAAGALIDRVFAGLPAKADLHPVAAASPQGLGRRIVVDLDVPQAAVIFGGAGIARKDPDFMAAYVVNYILGGGNLFSRLYREVREKRGLAYGVSDSLVGLKNASVMIGNTATRADRTGEALEVIESEIKRLAESGPTDEELARAKAFLKGSYALNLDTSSKIAGQLVQIQLDDLGIDYIDRREGLIDAVTMDDARRVARRLLDGEMLVTVVGRPQGLTSRD